MTDDDFIELALDRLLELAWTGADREAKRTGRTYCPSCLAGPLSRIFVLEIFPRIKDGSIMREMVEQAGVRAAREVFDVHN